jgi:cytochrome b561
METRKRFLLGEGTPPRTEVPNMRLANTDQRYGAAAIALHWLMAALISALVALGIYMVRLPDVGFDIKKIALILIHKEIGIVVLALAAARLAWRQLNPLPRLVETLPEWQKVTAIFVHLCFYALMVTLPVTGWVMSSASGIPVSLLGLFTLPDFVPHSETLFGWLRQVHDWLGYGMAMLICLHAGAALRHHFLLRDQTLRKMLWSSNS